MPDRPQLDHDGGGGEIIDIAELAIEARRDRRQVTTTQIAFTVPSTGGSSSAIAVTFEDPTGVYRCYVTVVINFDSVAPVHQQTWA
jgi:hypothetical protein